MCILMLINGRRNLAKPPRELYYSHKYKNLACVVVFRLRTLSSEVAWTELAKYTNIVKYHVNIGIFVNFTYATSKQAVAV